MLSLVGSASLGLVWGWLLVRRIFGARWPLVLRMLLWLAIQALLVLKLASPLSMIAFLISVVLSALVCYGWIRTLLQRYGSA